MKNTAQPGDTVELKDKETGFYDAETNFKVVLDQQVELGDNIGKRTNEAILSGGLLLVGGKAKGESAAQTAATGGADANPFAENYPGRDVLHGLGMTAEEVAKLDQAGLVGLKGIGEKTAVAILDYQKQ